MKQTTEGMNYNDYRQHIEKLTFTKQKLLKVINERKELHRTYRLAFQKWRELSDQELRLRDELITLIPSA
jgi:tRNA U54 and U55 pseudouridine synthase Pus10